MEEVAINRRSSNCLEHLMAAFLAMEPTQCLISLAQEAGGGCISSEVQSFIWEHCIHNHVVKSKALSHLYIKKFLKKVIVAVESSGHDVLDSFYEQYAYYMTSFKDDGMQNGDTRVCKVISFLFPDGHSENQSSPRTGKVVVPLRCSVNMLEGDTGCSIWPSSLFLSEFILSFPEIFSDKSCFEVGSGVGLVGISLTHANVSKVILSDGDLSSLANLKLNLEMNQLRTGSEVPKSTDRDLSLVECKYLPWESASVSELQDFRPDIVLGADITYDPLCMSHLVRVLAILLARKKCNPHQWKERCHTEILRNADDGINNADEGAICSNHGKTWEYPPKNNDVAPGFSKFDSHRRETCQSYGLDENRINKSDGCCSYQVEASNGGVLKSRSVYDVGKDGPVAYIAAVIRNADTFACFLRLADQAALTVVDITEMRKPLNLLPYMLSYDRSSVRLYCIYLM